MMRMKKMIIKQFIFALKRTMGVGFLRKLKDGIVNIGKKIGGVVKTVAKPIVQAGIKLAPIIGAGVGTIFGAPQIGAQIGLAVNKAGQALGIT